MSNSSYEISVLGRKFRHLMICQKCASEYYETRPFDGWFDCEEIAEKDLHCYECGALIKKGEVVYIWEYEVEVREE